MKLTVSYESQWSALEAGTPFGSNTDKPQVWLIIAGYEATVWPNEHDWGWVVYDVLANQVAHGFAGSKTCACDCAEAEIFNHSRRTAAV